MLYSRDDLPIEFSRPTGNTTLGVVAYLLVIAFVLMIALAAMFTLAVAWREGAQNPDLIEVVCWISIVPIWFVVLFFGIRSFLRQAALRVVIEQDHMQGTLGGRKRRINYEDVEWIQTFGPDHKSEWRLRHRAIGTTRLPGELAPRHRWVSAFSITLIPVLKRRLLRQLQQGKRLSLGEEETPWFRLRVRAFTCNVVAFICYICFKLPIARYFSNKGRRTERPGRRLGLHLQPARHRRCRWLHHPLARTRLPQN